MKRRFDEPTVRIHRDLARSAAEGLGMRTSLGRCGRGQWSRSGVSRREQTRTRAAMAYPEPVVVEPRKTHTASVVWLHGLGDSGHGWASISAQVQMPWVRYVFPTAPNRPITINQGLSMPGWFDLADLGDNFVDDKQGLMESVRFVQDIVEQEVSKGIPRERIVVGGFSQGGAVALQTLRSFPVGGVVALSSWLPLVGEKPYAISENQEAPILFCHGDNDEVVHFHVGEGSAEKLQADGLKVDFKAFPGMAHEACLEEIVEIKKFLMHALPDLE